MKKQYIAPIAEKYDFDYEENVTAASPIGNVKDGKTGHAANACYTHNGSDVYDHSCNEAIPKT